MHMSKRYMTSQRSRLSGPDRHRLKRTKRVISDLGRSSRPFASGRMASRLMATHGGRHHAGALSASCSRSAPLAAVAACRELSVYHACHRVQQAWLVSNRAWVQVRRAERSPGLMQTVST